MGVATLPDTVRIAVTQAEPIEEAAQHDAVLVTFPECWISGYPAWIWFRSVDPVLAVRHLKNTLQLESTQMDRIRACAASNNITVALGFSENFHNSAYISQALTGTNGKILMRRRKIKPTHMERTLFGDGTKDSLNNVVTTTFGRVGMLACWEHTQPLLKYHTWGARNLSQTYAIESQSFMLHTTAVLGQSGVDVMGTESGVLFSKPGRGSSAVFGPDGRQLTEVLPEDKEGIIYADLGTDAVLQAKSFIDVCGHYSRPDLLWLGVTDYEKKDAKLGPSERIRN
ncbi:carbon-nitrogen hydrolase [Melanomma pulvis-pyrius CBS 109.77]|uniref:nitrilase n=1 Tax=Melanomma pulvis-pyrius CBS 109.77 TaxID=1314802 RepID=A0A6A6WSM5_9PLEO|nr:carbon-nitrogen hydrolase [Melanomma pulvis-pyrius CBS 109.77]